MKTKKLKKGIIILFIAILLIFCMIGYYQLFSKSPQVDKGIAKLEYTFTGHKSIVTAVRFTNNDSFLITGSVDSTIKIWNRASGEIIRQIKQPSGISYLDVSADGKYIATGSYDSILRIWNVEGGKLVREFNGQKGTVWTVAFSKDGSMIAGSGDDGVIRIYDFASAKLIRELKGHTRNVWSVKFSNDGTHLASGSFDYSVKLWNIAEDRVEWNNTQHEEAVVDLAFSHNDSLLATTSDDQTIRIWNVKAQQVIRIMEAPEHVQAVAFSPDDKLLLTGGRDKPMMGELLQNIFGDSHYNKGVSARLWNVQTGELLQTFSHHANDVMDVAWSHNGKWMATASADGTVDIWKK